MGKCPFCNADVENHDMKEHFIENHRRKGKDIENSDEDNEVNVQKHSFTTDKFQIAGFKIQRRKSGIVDLFESNVDDRKDPIYNSAKDKDISDGNCEAENHPIGRGIKRVKSGPICNPKKLKRTLFSSRISSKKIIHKKIKQLASEDIVIGTALSLTLLGYAKKSMASSAFSSSSKFGICLLPYFTKIFSHLHRLTCRINVTGALVAAVMFETYIIDSFSRTSVCLYALIFIPLTNPLLWALHMHINSIKKFLTRQYYSFRSASPYTNSSNV